jgi:hypothetical protein
MEGQGTGVQNIQGIPASTGMTASGSMGALVPPGAVNPVVSRESGLPRAEPRGVVSGAEGLEQKAEGRYPNQTLNAKPQTPLNIDAGVQESDASEASSEDDTASDDTVVLPDLTDAQIFFLESEAYRRSSEEIVREFALTENDLIFLNEMDHAVLGGLIDLNQYVEALRSEFPALNASEKDRLIGTLLSARFVPFAADLHPSAAEAARAAKIVLKPRSYYRVYESPLTFAGAAHEIALMSGIPLTSQTQERIRDAFMSKLKGVRGDRQVEELLARTADVGGVGASPDVAKTAVEAMTDIARRAELMDEREYADWLNRKLHPAPEIPAPKPAETEEEKEIREIVARMPSGESESATALASSIRAILDRLSWKPDDPYLQRRLTNMVSTRLRDVRSRNEFFMKLMRDAKVGGLGLERKTAEQVTEEVEKGYAEFRNAVATEEKSKLDAQILEQEKKIEERKRREVEERQRWYEEKVASKKLSEEEGKKVFERLRIIARGETSPIELAVDQKDRAREKAAFGDLVPAPRGTRASAPSIPAPPERIVSPSSKPAQAKPAEKKVAPDPRKIPNPPIVKVSAQTADLRKAAALQRPRLDDVMTPAGSGARLAGPLEQIGSMSIAQFRRLAPVPDAAAKRIEDLVGLLAQESFERRIAGIQAWQKSPIQAVYLKLVAEAFRNGKPVKALAEEKRKADGDMLSSEELDAIIKLNGMMRL